MSLHPDLVPIVEFLATVEEQPPSEDRVAELREAYAGLCAAFGPGSPDVAVRDLDIEGPAGALAARVYRPERMGGASRQAAARNGAILWFHGGGWVIGGLETHDSLCRDLCAAAGTTVVSVAYRLAPEHRAPAASDDALAAYDWLVGHAAALGIDPAMIVVGGDSAGGHLATVTARRVRDRGGPCRPAAQVLVYPVADLRPDAGRYASRERNGSGYILTTSTMDFFGATYLPDPSDRSGPDASPIVADLAGLPRALVVVAEYDPLHDEGLAYADKLAAAGVDTVVERVEGGVHLVAQMVATEPGRDVIRRIAAFVSETLEEARR